MMMDRLVQAVNEKGPVCVGLDTQYDFLPAFLREQDKPVSEKVFEFNRRIIDATADVAGCYKAQIAFYEAMGMEGMLAFRDTIAYVRGKGMVAITDAKRGDIASTAKQYANAHFSGDFETDLLTVNAYMGEDAVSPYYDYLGEHDKGLFVLVKTSNPSGVDFQDRMVDGLTLYQQVAKKVSTWGEQFMGQCGYSAIGAVAGCTYAEEFDRIRDLMPHTFFLIPGYGAQGGTGKDVAAFFKDKMRGVVNSSRGIICAYKKTDSDGSDFDECARRAAIAMKEDILAWL